MNPEYFQQEFHSKTVAYQPRFRSDDRPVVVNVPEDAHTPAGHALLCALMNQLARTHQRLVVVGDLERPLLCRDVFGLRSVAGATAGLATAINPFITVDVVERVPHAAAIVVLGLGSADSDVRLGCSGWRAQSGETAFVGSDRHDVWGAMFAACLGAWIAFNRLLGQRAMLRESCSLWDFGVSDRDGPAMEHDLDVGRVLQVGVGGVGAALDYWLALAGVAGTWVLVDPDAVEVSNLNRQLLFIAADAGYPDGGPRNKAGQAVQRLGVAGTASPHWYGEDSSIVESDYDVILALANERGVRGALQDREPRVLLHATTSANYQAHFHRHLHDVDDCIRCRLPGEAPRLRCATGQIDDLTEDDAALPFLSGAAGLLLAAGLARLDRGEITEGLLNLATIDFAGSFPAAQQLRNVCNAGCRRWTTRRAQAATS